MKYTIGRKHILYGSCSILAANEPLRNPAMTAYEAEALILRFRSRLRQVASHRKLVPIHSLTLSFSSLFPSCSHPLPRSLLLLGPSPTFSIHPRFTFRWSISITDPNRLECVHKLPFGG